MKIIESDLQKLQEGIREYGDSYSFLGEGIVLQEDDPFVTGMVQDINWAMWNAGFRRGIGHSFTPEKCPVGAVTFSLFRIGRNGGIWGEKYYSGYRIVFYNEKGEELGERIWWK